MQSHYKVPGSPRVGRVFFVYGNLRQFISKFLFAINNAVRFGPELRISLSLSLLCKCTLWQYGANTHPSSDAVIESPRYPGRLTALVN